MMDFKLGPRAKCPFPKRGCSYFTYLPIHLCNYVIHRKQTWWVGTWKKRNSTHTLNWCIRLIWIWNTHLTRCTVVYIVQPLNDKILILFVNRMETKFVLVYCQRCNLTFYFYYIIFSVALWTKKVKLKRHFFGTRHIIQSILYNELACVRVYVFWYRPFYP